MLCVHLFLNFEKKVVFIYAFEAFLNVLWFRFFSHTSFEREKRLQLYWNNKFQFTITEFAIQLWISCGSSEWVSVRFLVGYNIITVAVNWERLQISDLSVCLKWFNFFIKIILYHIMWWNLFSLLFQSNSKVREIMLTIFDLVSLIFSL
jgi:hypothetical protein